MRHRFYTLGAGLALLTGLLAGCGGGGATTAAAASSNAGVAGISTQVETAASFALDGLDAGIYGLPKGAAPAIPSGFEAPAASPVHSVPDCSNSPTGAVTATSTGADLTSIVYTNCIVDGSTLNGTINIAGPTAYTTTGVWTATFAGFSVSGKGVDDKTVKFNYSGTQVISGLTWSGTSTTAEATAGKVTLNVDINVDNGTSSIKFTNYLVDFSYNTTSQETTLRLSGKFGYDLKLADFGVPATPGVPEKVNVEFDVSTPTALKFTDTTASGVYKLSSSLYTLEIDYTNDVAKFTAGGVTQTFPLAA